MQISLGIMAGNQALNFNNCMYLHCFAVKSGAWAFAADYAIKRLNSPSFYYYAIPSPSMLSVAREND
jgi:hypothetical protein